MKLFIALMLLFLAGCAGVATVARPAPMPGTVSPSEYGEAETAFAGEDAAAAAGSTWSVTDCQRLLNSRDGLVWAAAFAGGLGGAGGLGSAFPDDSRQDVRLGLGITSAVLAAFATSVSLIAKSRSAEFEQYCNQKTTEMEGGL